MKKEIRFLLFLIVAVLATYGRYVQYKYAVGQIGTKPLVLTFSKSGDLMEMANGDEKKAPKTIHVKQWQKMDFVHNTRHAEFKIDRAAANDLFLQYQGTEERGEDTVEKYEAFNYGTTFYLHVDVDADSGKKHKAIPFEVEPDSP